jgi:hypothetical protein
MSFPDRMTELPLCCVHSFNTAQEDDWSHIPISRDYTHPIDHRSTRYRAGKAKGVVPIDW